MEQRGAFTFPPIDDAPQIARVTPPPGSPNDPARAEPPAAAVPKTAPVEVASLAFTGTAREKTLPLQFPFDLDGKHHNEVRIRRLTTQEVGDLMGAGSRSLDLYQVYSVMTGLPPAVLRGLDAEDGLTVTGVCSGFLPRLLKDVYGFE